MSIEGSFSCLHLCISIGISTLLFITCCKRESLEEEESETMKQESLNKVQQEMLKAAEHKEALEKIRAGKMRPAHENETVEEAVSNWGAIQQIEGLPRKRKKI